MGCSRTPIQKKIRNFDEKAVGKTQKAVGKTKKAVGKPKKLLEKLFFLKPLNLAADSRYPPPYPRWVGGLPQVGGWSEAPNPENGHRCR